MFNSLICGYILSSTKVGAFLIKMTVVIEQYGLSKSV